MKKDEKKKTVKKKIKGKTKLRHCPLALNRLSQVWINHFTEVLGLRELTQLEIAKQSDKGERYFLDDTTLLAFSFADVIDEVNFRVKRDENIPEDLRDDYVIPYTTFMDYGVALESGEPLKDDVNSMYVNNVLSSFTELYKKATRLMKKSIVIMLKYDQKWQKYAWFLERKFRDDRRSPYKELADGKDDPNAVDPDSSLTRLLNKAREEPNEMIDATYVLPEKK